MPGPLSRFTIELRPSYSDDWYWKAMDETNKRYAEGYGSSFRSAANQARDAWYNPSSCAWYPMPVRWLIIDDEGPADPEPGKPTLDLLE